MSSFVTIVTGAAGGFGAELVGFLVERGQRVAAVDRPQSADRLSALGAGHGASVLALPLDVTSKAEWRPALERIEQELGGPARGAVLAAGGFKGGVDFHAQGADAVWRAMLEINLETARVALGAISERMVDRKWN